MEKNRINFLNEHNLIQKVTIALLVVFLVVFPKGGVKVGTVPLTWGYCLLAFIGYFQLLRALINLRLFKLHTPQVISLICLIPFQVVAIIYFALNGIEGDGFFIAFLITFYFLPWAFFLALYDSLNRINLNYLINVLGISLLIISVFGIVQFIYKIKTGNFIEIPYLTLNAADIGALDEKSIDRGGVFKLISTYNNGNIYGVCILIFLPLYETFEKSRWKKIVVKVSLVLTLSRTVWIGLICFEVGYLLYIKRASTRTIMKLLFGLLLICVVVGISLNLMKQGSEFIFDKDFGGRLEQIDYIRDINFVSNRPFVELAEITYLSIIRYFGIIGLIAFFPFLAAPIFLNFLGYNSGSNTAYKRSLTLGLILYLIISCSDGAILYIPVMVFYWFAAALLISNNLPSKKSSEIISSKILQIN